MSRFCSLFSSSSGNCTYIASASTGILIDCGVSAKRIENALKSREIAPKFLKGIFVTHEHRDHISGIKIFASRYNIPVFSTEGTLLEMEKSDILTGKFNADVISYNGMEIGDIFIKPFKTPHDTPESCGYTLKMPDERKISVTTDIGHITDEITRNITGSDLILLESNHDIGMLQNGPYPYLLKRRILSDYGHLCNEKCAETVVNLLKTGTSRFFLGHLSEQNNLPDLAFQTAFNALTEEGAKFGTDYTLEVCMKESDRNLIRF